MDSSRGNVNQNGKGEGSCVTESLILTIGKERWKCDPVLEKTGGEISTEKMNMAVLIN